MLISLFGGTGFLGKSLTRELCHAGYRVRIAARGNEKYLPSLYGQRQVELFACDLRSKASLTQVLEGADVAINLIGILQESPQSSFAFAHAEVPALIAQACQEASVPRMIHISALGASKESLSLYGRTKAMGEKRLLGVNKPAVQIFRPSIVLGRQSGFVKLMLAIARRTPVLFLPCGFSRVQPVSVQDFVRVLILSLKGKVSRPVFNIAGSRVFNMRELVQLIIRCSPLRGRVVLPLDYFSSYAAASLLGKFMSDAPLTKDNCLSIKEGTLCSAAENHSLELLGEMKDIEMALREDFAVPSSSTNS